MMAAHANRADPVCAERRQGAHLQPLLLATRNPAAGADRRRGTVSSGVLLQSLPEIAEISSASVGSRCSRLADQVVQGHSGFTYHGDQRTLRQRATEDRSGCAVRAAHMRSKRRKAFRSRTLIICRSRARHRWPRNPHTRRGAESCGRKCRIQPLPEQGIDIGRLPASAQFPQRGRAAGCTSPTRPARLWLMPAAGGTAASRSGRTAPCADRHRRGLQIGKELRAALRLIQHRPIGVAWRDGSRGSLSAKSRTSGSSRLIIAASRENSPGERGTCPPGADQ